MAHELPSSRGSRPLPLAGPFQSPCVLASWTSCVRTASSASSSPWCVTASSSVGMAPTRTRSSRDAVSRGRWRDSGGGPPGHMSPSSFQVSTEGPDLAFLRKVHLGCFGSLPVSCWCTAHGGIKVDSGPGPHVASSRSLACAPGGAASPCCSVCTRLTSTPHTAVIQWAASPAGPRAGPCLIHGYSPAPKTAPPA